MGRRLELDEIDPHRFDHVVQGTPIAKSESLARGRLARLRDAGCVRILIVDHHSAERLRLRSASGGLREQIIDFARCGSIQSFASVASLRVPDFPSIVLGEPVAPAMAKQLVKLYCQLYIYVNTIGAHRAAQYPQRRGESARREVG